VNILLHRYITVFYISTAAFIFATFFGTVIYICSTFMLG